jgi:hypothetical protein
MTGRGAVVAMARPKTAARPDGVQLAQLLIQLLADGTAALAHLDAESLELLQVRAVQLGMQMDGQVHALREDEDEYHRLTNQHKIFADVLRATQEHLNLLKRMNGRGMVSPWDR